MPCLIFVVKAKRYPFESSIFKLIHLGRLLPNWIILGKSILLVKIIGNEGKKFYSIGTSGLYYKHFTIIMSDACAVNNLSLTLSLVFASVVNYDRK